MMESATQGGELRQPSRKAKIARQVERMHRKIPGARKIPLPAVTIIVTLVCINAIVWVACGVVLHYHPALISTALLSWILGLRHALDADHISAIDLMTRRLLAAGQKPVTVGTFFSLGHSTIVIVTSIIVAATSAAVSQKFDKFSHIGGIIGSAVSASFLLLLGIMNVYIGYKMYVRMRVLLNANPDDECGDTEFLAGGGPMFRILRRMFKLIDKPWKMYPLGILFGLGFDTSSEIALLGISSLQAAKGTSIWLILLFPLLFTAGMCMLDTIDGALMMSLYSSASQSKDQIATCFFSLALTAITIVVAIFIGTVQFLILGAAVISEEEAERPFWRGVNSLDDRYDIVGGCICGAFAFFGILSYLLYKPWRRRIDRKRVRAMPLQEYRDRVEPLPHKQSNENVAPTMKVTRIGKTENTVDEPSLLTNAASVRVQQHSSQP